MKTLTYTQPHHLSTIHDELIAAVPALAPEVGADGRRVARASVSGDGSTLTLRVPDDTDEAAVLAVVEAHDPTPPPPPPDPDAELAAAITAVSTSEIVDPAARAAMDALKAALLGGTRRGRVAGRPL